MGKVYGKNEWKNVGFKRKKKRWFQKEGETIFWHFSEFTPMEISIEFDCKDERNEEMEWNGKTQWNF